MKRKLLLAPLIVFIVLFNGCQQVGNENEFELEGNVTELENPYSLGFMQTVQDEMVEWGEAEPKKLEAIHLYVKFTPKNNDEVDLLVFRDDLELYDYPITNPKFETTASRSGLYRDPNIAPDQPNPLYGAVKKGTQVFLGQSHIH